MKQARKTKIIIKNHSLEIPPKQTKVDVWIILNNIYWLLAGCSSNISLLTWSFLKPFTWRNMARNLIACFISRLRKKVGAERVFKWLYIFHFVFVSSSTSHFSRKSLSSLPWSLPTQEFEWKATESSSGFCCEQTWSAISLNCDPFSWETSIKTEEKQCSMNMSSQLSDCWAHRAAHWGT